MNRALTHTTTEILDWLSDPAYQGAGVILIFDDQKRMALGWVCYEGPRLRETAGRQAFWRARLNRYEHELHRIRAVILRRSRSGRFNSNARRKHGIQEHRCYWIPDPRPSETRRPSYPRAAVTPPSAPEPGCGHALGSPFVQVPWMSVQPPPGMRPMDQECLADALRAAAMVLSAMTPLR